MSFHFCRPADLLNGRWLPLVTAVCLAFATGCQRQKGTVLGRAPEGQAHTVLAVRSGDTPSQVTISGVMIDKCPVAGCWFHLRDRTGTIKVDTKSAGFVVVNVPLQTIVTVAGKVVADGEDVALEAIGVSY